MEKVCVFLADGFEEGEALIPVDLLRRAGAEVTIASISASLCVQGAHGICVTALWRKAYRWRNTAWWCCPAGCGARRTFRAARL